MKTTRKLAKGLLWGELIVLLTLAPVCYAVTQTCVQPPVGLVSWWAGDGNADDIADGNDGIMQNGVTFAAGKVGQGFSFDGVDDFVQVPSASNLDLASSFTWDAWINPSSIDNAPVIFERFNQVVDRIGFEVFADGSLCGYFSRGCQLSSPAGFVSTDTFTHVAFVFDDAADQLKLYANGVLIKTATFTGSPGGQGAELVIGKSKGIRGFEFKGVIDELEVFDRALSDAEIQSIFNAGSAGKCKVTTATLTVSPTTVTVNVGETVRVNATFDSGCAGCPNVSAVEDSVIFTSNNPSVAFVNFTYLLSSPIAYYIQISGISPGSTTVTVTYSPTMNGALLGTATVDIPVTVTGGNSGGGTGCASFNLFTSTLHIPCFNPGSPPTYWIDLMLQPSNGISFGLVNFGENTTSIANNNATFNLFNGKLHVPCLDFGALPTYWLDLGLSTQGDQLLFNLDNFGQN